MKKTILIIVLVVLVLGIGTAAYFMLNPPVEDLTVYEDIGDFDGTDAEPVTNDAVKDSVKEALRKQYEKEVEDYDKVFQNCIINNKLFKVTVTDREGYDTSYYLALLKYENKDKEEVYDTAIVSETFQYFDRMDGLYNTYNEIYIRMNQNNILKMRSTPARSPITYLSMVQFTGKKLIHKSTKDLDVVKEYIDERQKYLDNGDIDSLSKYTLGSNALDFSYHEEEYLTQLTKVLELADQKAQEAVNGGNYEKAADYYSAALNDIYVYFGIETVTSLTTEILDKIDQSPYLPSKEYYVNTLYSFADAMSHVDNRKQTADELNALLQRIAPR